MSDKRTVRQFGESPTRRIVGPQLNIQQIPRDGDTSAFEKIREAFLKHILGSEPK